MKTRRIELFAIFFIVALFGGVLFFEFIGEEDGLSYSTDLEVVRDGEETKEMVTHVPVPEAVKAIYMTSWVAGTKSRRDELVKLIDDTEINAVVIDIKDYSGALSFSIPDPLIEEINAVEKRIPDIKDFVKELHKKEIYVIGRVTVFQDPHLISVRPDLAVKRASDGGIWKDKKGLTYADPGNKFVWEYHVAIAKGAYALGFDEINFDYIRFPSDGNMRDIYFPASEAHITAHPDTGKADIIENFFKYLSASLSGTGLVLSADLFGMTATNYDDLNIGQVLERAAPHFDYIAPMVYPSHYPPTFIGLANPAAHPYEVVKYSMDKAYARLVVATSTPTKLRPWLQDFDLGADYTTELVRAQIQATYDAGLTSWMLWDPSNRYTKKALLPFYESPTPPQ